MHIAPVLLASFAAAAFGCGASAWAVETTGPVVSSTGPSGAVSPIFGVRLPADYRRWEMVAVSQEVGVDEFRGIVGNPVALKAYRDGTLPFPDGAVLVKIAWKRVPSGEFDGAFVPGDPTTVQVMTKDAKRYAATSGWGFGRFVAGKPVDEAQHRTCFGCHVAHVKNHDIVFTRFAR